VTFTQKFAQNFIMAYQEIIDRLVQKYERDKQPTETYLQGLLHAKPITYWDYIDVDVLLNLQKPRTHFPDEMTFIVYHQVTELLLKVAMHELKQACLATHSAQMLTHVERATRYVHILAESFDVMRLGMDPVQYDQFRLSLAPASGFQSGQFRMLEIVSTDLWLLMSKSFKEKMEGETDPDKLFEHIYWQEAGKDRKTGEKSLLLRLFEERYLNSFKAMATEYADCNLRKAYGKLAADENSEALKKALRDYDYAFNVHWPIVHLRAAEAYLEHGQTVKAATGGSEWKRYLHPSFQRRIFYPELWSSEELDNWGNF
jgi:tryptophan 2,3-dioxygenase